MGGRKYDQLAGLDLDDGMLGFLFILPFQQWLFWGIFSRVCFKACITDRRYGTVSVSGVVALLLMTIEHHTKIRTNTICLCLNR